MPGHVGPDGSDNRVPADDLRDQPRRHDAHTTHVSSSTGDRLPPRIGPFRILGLIGEGAMGIVYEAEQERPHRRVALKIVRPGLVPAAVLRRFELEYEFLGRLHHAGIAQIYQAGIEETDHGHQPYFAMELVRGQRLDDYVRSKSLPLRQRLMLLAAIAEAVQHAHHRGIIHRDLKPANILVTGAGEPKILDFGIARAMHDDVMTTIQTMAGEVLGTLNYMSPEQVSGDVSALDTRSDVYALGVILYEVIAERPPYDLARKSFAESARIIHDEEPTRLGSTAQGIPADVETIVAKALEKEKERRYSSAAELAEDIHRFLKDEPIAARPASAAYQARKFARRHKALVAGVLAAVVALLVGVVATSWQAIRASRAERAAQARAHDAEVEAAKAEAVTTFLTDMLASVDPSQAQGRDVSVRDALDAAATRIDSGAMADQPAAEAAVRNTIGTTYGSLGQFDTAERQLRASLALQTRTAAGALERADTHNRLVNVLYLAGKHAEAEKEAREALTLRREALGTLHADVATSLDDLGAMRIARGDATGAEALMREALEIRRKILPEGDPQFSVGLNNLGYVMWRTGNLEEAESLYQEALGIDRRALGNDHPEIPTRLVNLVVLLSDQGRAKDAEPLAREAVATRRRILGDQHPALANALDALAGVLEDQGRNAEAEELLREALTIARGAYGEVHRETARQQLHLGWLLWKEGRYPQAEPYLRDAAANIPRTYGETHRMARAALSNLAHELNSLGDARTAETRAREALDLYRQTPDDDRVVNALIALGHALIARGRSDEAIPYLREAVDRSDPHSQVRFPWYRGEAESTLGSVLAEQGDLAEAERLLLSGYEGLRDTSSTPPPRLRVAVERLVSFYEKTDRPAEAAEWRTHR